VPFKTKNGGVISNGPTPSTSELEALAHGLQISSESEMETDTDKIPRLAECHCPPSEKQRARQDWPGIPHWNATLDQEMV
jgi:hypothetical protein